MRPLRVVISTGICLLSCRGPEEEALSKFFAAVRSEDHATIAGMSVVALPGLVDSWEMVEIQSESNQPFRLPELRDRAAKAEQEREHQFLEYSRFRRENLEDLKAIRDRLDKDPDYRFQGRRGEIQVEWEKFRNRYGDLDERRQEILREVEEELKLAKMSLLSSEEIDSLEGEVVIREVLLRVTTREAGDKPYRFTLRKYNLTSKQSNYRPLSRWIITGIEET